MKKLLFFVVAFLLFATSQNFLKAQDRNNEDEVVHLDKSTRSACVPNQVIVKFLDASSIKLKAFNNKSFTAENQQVNNILRGYPVENIEQLFPNFQFNPDRIRVTTSFTGKDIVEHDLSQMYLITLREDNQEEKDFYTLIQELNDLEIVDFAEPNYIMYALGSEAEETGNIITFSENEEQSEESDTTYRSWYNDPMYSLQWGIPSTHLDSLWAKPKLPNINRKIIAIIDTGVDIDHPDLTENIWTNEMEVNGAENTDDDNNGYKDDIHGYDFVNLTGEMHDFNSHGTHCAGIAAAVGGNHIGITGANPDALIMPIAVLQSNGQGNVATIIKGINYAAENGADILSMSFGTYAYSTAMEQALAHAYQTSVLVAAAGNDGRSLLGQCSCPNCGNLFPAAFTFVLGIQSNDDNNNLSFSNYDCDGPTFSAFSEEELYNYELTAPGVNIISTIPNGQYRNYNGTSMACPLVAGGISALLDRKEYANKEILFANLIYNSEEFHPVNFLQAYENDSMPSMLQMVNYELNDTLYGDGSWYADAGERIQIYPAIRNVGGQTNGITLWLETQEFEDTTLFTFNSNYVDFGHSLSTYAKGKSANPIDITLRENIVDGRVMQLTIFATSPNSLDTLRHNFTIKVTKGVKLDTILSGNAYLYPDNQYIVHRIGVPEGDTLFVLPGTVLRFEKDATTSISGRIVAKGTPDSLIYFTSRDLEDIWTATMKNGYFSYCVIENRQSGVTWGASYGSFPITYSTIENCIMHNLRLNNSSTSIQTDTIKYSNIFSNGDYLGDARNISYTNIADNVNEISAPKVVFDPNRTSGLFIEDETVNIKTAKGNNFMPNKYVNDGYRGLYGDMIFMTGWNTNNNPVLERTLDSNYYGSSLENIVRRKIYDFYYPNSTSFTKVYLTKMSPRPFKEAHGVVWKVEVNGFDAQDEFDSIPPLGVGTHEFKVYFNRAMDTAFAPMVAMGVRPPYTQTGINENAFWSEDSIIYTCYKTLTGKDAIDGLNRIYVDGARDDEHFEIPFEDQRFNVYVESSGSMSAGFQATAGLGKVELEWNNQEMNVDDFLGFNMYRYQYDSVLTNQRWENGAYVYDTVYMPVDTIMINSSLIVDTLFTDYDVVPGERYYYYYKILRTSLDENSPSKTVSSMPLSSIKGDANGSMTVDVADVISTVNYVTGNNPQPFIFEAADINDDGEIDVLDIVGIINIILHPGQTENKNQTEQQTAIYTIENDTLFVNTPVELGGVQFVFTRNENSHYTPLAALQNFEKMNTQTEDTYTFLAFSMTGEKLSVGKHALLRLENAELNNIVLSDTKGHNVIALKGATVGLLDIESLQAGILSAYPNPFSSEVRIDFAIGKREMRKAELIFTDIMGRKIETKTFPINATGKYSYIWNAEGRENGVYFVQLRIDGALAQTYKLILNR